MTNAELIKALRYCAEHEGCDYYIAKDCPRESTWMCGVDCGQILISDAADAIEAAEKRIADLEAQLWCPIKGVLPDEHGDLIDRDALKEKKVYSHERHEYVVPVAFIDWEHAVIEAERQTE